MSKSFESRYLYRSFENRYLYRYCKLCHHDFIFKALRHPWLCSRCTIFTHHEITHCIGYYGK